METSEKEGGRSTYAEMDGKLSMLRAAPSQTNLRTNDLASIRQSKHTCHMEYVHINTTWTRHKITKDNQIDAGKPYMLKNASSPCTTGLIKRVPLNVQKHTTKREPGHPRTRLVAPLQRNGCPGSRVVIRYILNPRATRFPGHAFGLRSARNRVLELSWAAAALWREREGLPRTLVSWGVFDAAY